VTLEEFQHLVPPFEATFQAHMAVWRLAGKPRTARRFTVLFLGDTFGDHVYDKRIADTTPYSLPAGSRLLQELGFLAFTLPPGRDLHVD
jgi:hypothetical protein